MNKPISRQEESLLPKFNSHKEARKYFTDLYKDDFILQSSEYIGEQICHFYVLVINREDFEKGQTTLLNENLVSGLDYLYSHQPIQIMDDGSVHIVH